MACGWEPLGSKSETRLNRGPEEIPEFWMVEPVMQALSLLLRVGFSASHVWLVLGIY
jgi:hypothetical protein